MDDIFNGLVGYGSLGIRPRQFLSEKRKNRKFYMTRYNMVMMLRRTLQMFDWNIVWKGEPSKKIKKRNLELLVQSNGFAGLVEIDNELYALFGTLGGQPNWDYMPSKFIFANAFLNTSGERNVYDLSETEKKDCVIIPNDSMYQGTIPTLSYHSEFLTELELTKKFVSVWARAPHTFTAPTSNSVEDIKSYLRDLEEGKFSAIFDKNMLKDMKDLGSDNSMAKGTITQILEAIQYEKASMFNDVGLQMNYNMKRETITSSEAQLGEGALKPLPDDMMDMRKIAAKEAMDLWNGDLTIEVEFSSAWKDLRKSIQLGLEKEAAEAKADENEDVQSTGQGENENVENDNDLSDRNGQQSDPVDIDGTDTSDGNAGDTDNRPAEEVVAEVARELDLAAQQLEEVVQSTGQGEDNEKTEENT